MPLTESRSGEQHLKKVLTNGFGILSTTRNEHTLTYDIVLWTDIRIDEPNQFAKSVSSRARLFNFK